MVAAASVSQAEAQSPTRLYPPTVLPPPQPLPGTRWPGGLRLFLPMPRIRASQQTPDPMEPIEPFEPPQPETGIRCGS